MWAVLMKRGRGPVVCVGTFHVSGYRYCEERPRERRTNERTNEEKGLGAFVSFHFSVYTIPKSVIIGSTRASGWAGYSFPLFARLLSLSVVSCCVTLTWISLG